MADESISTLQDAIALVRAQAAEVLWVHVGKGGGLGPAQKNHRRRRRRGTHLHRGQQPGNKSCHAAMIHLAMLSPSIGAEEFPCDILGPFFYGGDLLAEPLEISAG
jgi:L-alanine-DL-glutamate epimerase-like enolase superfamily enzyme